MRSLTASCAEHLPELLRIPPARRPGNSLDGVHDARQTRAPETWGLDIGNGQSNDRTTDRTRAGIGGAKEPQKTGRSRLACRGRGTADHKRHLAICTACIAEVILSRRPLHTPETHLSHTGKVHIDLTGGMPHKFRSAMQSPLA
ncbi:hypothetical protein Dvul_1971 [Nitratidesulfovibrio vulgaris DP4]|uniref:Uncharacterized protein n=1 Tax=Nitratidesulfovibrio vulgaris (strain DP4) TaxID=391774 RepID=A0A0H3A9L5_NITV4|nr:hypothetical protein Dvul_1971 [Nitratidesulfovibrio vulgaris DP4]